MAIYHLLISITLQFKICSLVSKEIVEKTSPYDFSRQLTWRDMQHLTVLTSKRNSLYDSKGRFHWTMNGVGLEFNHLFGFGVLDAGAMVALAKQWKSVPARYHCEAGSDKTIR